MSKKDRKPILCVDFDGVLHKYQSGWRGARCIPDGPVGGAMEFLHSSVRYFEVHIYSSRSHQWGGRRAMKRWLAKWLVQRSATPCDGDDVLSQLKFPRYKPPALVSLDDRAITFYGSFPDPSSMLRFRPWNKLS